MTGVPCPTLCGEAKFPDGTLKPLADYVHSKVRALGDRSMEMYGARWTYESRKARCVELYNRCLDPVFRVILKLAIKFSLNMSFHKPIILGTSLVPSETFLSHQGDFHLFTRSPSSPGSGPRSAGAVGRGCCWAPTPTEGSKLVREGLEQPGRGVNRSVVYSGRPCGGFVFLLF